jgi:outer membrane immunogenic protein
MPNGFSKVSLAAAILVAGATAAGAADIPARAPVYKAPAMVPVLPWTGFYVGANVGYGWGDVDGTINLGAGPGPITGDADGIVGGAQVGYNWQTGPWVFGVETDIQASGADGNVTATPGGALVTATGKVPWFGTIRGRVGYAFASTMIYATGGGAYGESELEGTVSTTGPFSSSENFWTYTVGGGVEHMFMPHWSAKLEYLYTGTPDHVALPPGTVGATGDVNSHLVRVGINYHF